MAMLFLHQPLASSHQTKAYGKKEKCNAQQQQITHLGVLSHCEFKWHDVALKENDSKNEVKSGSRKGVTTSRKCQDFLIAMAIFYRLPLVATLLEVAILFRDGAVAFYNIEGKKRAIQSIATIIVLRD
jgi:hypothetical protein